MPASDLMNECDLCGKPAKALASVELEDPVTLVIADYDICMDCAKAKGFRIEWEAGIPYAHPEESYDAGE